MFSVRLRVPGVATCAGLVGLALCTAFAGEAPLDQAKTLENLQSKDEILQIRALWDVARAGRTAGWAEGAVAGLMKETPRGRRLAPWCYHALSRIATSPQQHVSAFMLAASWENKAGGPLTDAKGPELPQELREAEQTVWQTSVALLASQARSQDDKIRNQACTCIRLWNAPAKLAIACLFDLTSDPGVEPNNRHNYGYQLGGYTDNAEAMGLIAAGARDPRAAVRVYCLRALGRYCRFRKDAGALANGEKPMDLILAGQNDADPKVRDAALLAMGIAGQGAGPQGMAAATDAMVSRLSDQDPKVRSQAASGLASAKGVAAEPVWKALAARYKVETDVEVRRSILRALGARAPREALPALLGALQDPEPRTRGVAADAIGTMARRLREESPEELPAMAKEAVPPLVAILKEDVKGKDYYLVGTAARSLGEIGPDAKAALPEIIRWLRKTQGSDFVRALGEMGEPAAVAIPDLVGCLETKGSQYNLARAFGRLGVTDPKVEGALLKLLAVQDSNIREQAAIAFGKLQFATAAVRDALGKAARSDSSPLVREAAQKALAGAPAPANKKAEDF